MFISLGQFEAVVFDLLYTLVHPGEFPGGGDRITWLAALLGIDERAVQFRWDAFEPLLESGRAPAARALGPELTWLTQMAADLGRPMGPEILAAVERDRDVTRRRALFEPPAETLDTLSTLRSEGVKIGVLSNTHVLELRSWPESPLSDLVDGVALSHEIGAVKPFQAAYDAVLERIGVPAGAAAYVGDGNNDELVGARQAGFALIVLAAEAPMRFSPDRLPVLRAQADVVLSTLGELPAALMDVSIRCSGGVAGSQPHLRSGS